MRPAATRFDFQEHEASGFAALERRKDAEKTIVLAAQELERAEVAGMRPADIELRRKALLMHVRTYNQAEADIAAARVKLLERAERRP